MYEISMGLPKGFVCVCVLSVNIVRLQPLSSYERCHNKTLWRSHICKNESTKIVVFFFF